MNCKQAQRDIALWAGHDLDDSVQKEAVRRHVVGCPCCRTHYQRMKQTMHVLERAERPVTYVSEDSLWPALAARISHAQRQPATSWNTKHGNATRLSGWMPFVAMTAACFILLLVVNERPQHLDAPLQRGLPTTPLISTEGAPANRYGQFSENKPFESRDASDDLRRLNELRLNKLRLRGRPDDF